MITWRKLIKTWILHTRCLRLVLNTCICEHTSRMNHLKIKRLLKTLPPASYSWSAEYWNYKRQYIKMCNIFSFCGPTIQERYPLPPSCSPHASLSCATCLQLTNVHPFIHSSHSSVICQTTGPQPLPRRFLHLMRSRASSFKWEYHLLSPRSSSNFLRLLPRLLLEGSFYVRYDQSN